MTKKRLNITLEPEVIERARRYCQRHDTSISQLVGGFLSTLATPKPAGEEADLPPAVQRLHGIAKGGPDQEDYRRHLLEKYG